VRREIYPFAAIVGQSEMKLALLLAAIDWRLSVLLRGDRGSGKTTTARALAALLPAPAPFVNLPIGATEDRLLGGLDLERTLKGEPVLKRGLLSEAHGGVLYVDEVNLLPGHLGDALLDAAASGVHVVEREGLSASHAAEFVLLGSMNPEEGSLRPQLLDRFALCVSVAAPMDTDERRRVVERRIEFERDPGRFMATWSVEQLRLQEQVVAARAVLSEVVCTSEMLALISVTVCENGVRSMRADLAVVRAAVACAALGGDTAVDARHVASVLPLVLSHRRREGDRAPASRPSMPPQPASAQDYSREDPSQEGSSEGSAERVMERVFSARRLETPALNAAFDERPVRGVSSSISTSSRGAVVGARRTESPGELDIRATLNHAVLETGVVQVRTADLHERVREARTGTRFLFVIDSSGSHAALERMRLVKGAASELLTRSFRNDDEVAMIAFRGSSAEVILEPTKTLADALRVLEYLPTGGRTPLAHALDLARNYVTPSTLLVLLTDGRANVPLRDGDPWQEALDVAGQMRCRALVIDTENAVERHGRSKKLAEALEAHYVPLEALAEVESAVIEIERLAKTSSRP
jgi:magnesium chelatase subunit D